MKVYGGNTGGTHRGIIAAKSKAEAIRLLNEQGLNVSSHHFKGYWGQTGNPTEVSIASGNPGVVFVQSYREGYSAAFKRFKE